MMEQRIRFCVTSDGARIAYAVAGSGPALVLTAPWVTHLELEWGTPACRAYLEALAAHRTVVRYDRHGCGLSDRDRTDFSLAADVRPLAAVIDHLGLERFDLLGRSAGGPTAVAYAAAHPTRVARLILFGTFAHSAPDPLQATLAELIRTSWGIASRTFADLVGPDADVAWLRWFAHYQREAASAETAAALWARPSDVRPLLPTLTMPTTVIHRRDDQNAPFAQGRELAAAIPGARLVPLDGAAHIEWLGDPNQVLRILAEVLGFPFTPIAAPAVTEPTGVFAAAPAAPATLPDGLTPREAEVLGQLAAGRTNKAIAAALGVAVPTVERHLVNLYTKIGARGRADATAYALRHRLDTPVA